MPSNRKARRSVGFNPQEERASLHSTPEDDARNRQNPSILRQSGSFLNPGEERSEQHPTTQGPRVGGTTGSKERGVPEGQNQGAKKGRHFIAMRIPPAAGPKRSRANLRQPPTTPPSGWFLGNSPTRPCPQGGGGGCPTSQKKMPPILTTHPIPEGDAHTILRREGAWATPRPRPRWSGRTAPLPVSEFP